MLPSINRIKGPLCRESEAIKGDLCLFQKPVVDQDIIYSSLCMLCRLLGILLLKCMRFQPTPPTPSPNELVKLSIRAPTVEQFKGEPRWGSISSDRNGIILKLKEEEKDTAVFQFLVLFVKNRRLTVTRTRTAVAATHLCPVVCTELWHHERGMKYATKVTNYTYVTGQRAFFFFSFFPFSFPLLLLIAKEQTNRAAPWKTQIRKNKQFFGINIDQYWLHEPNGTGKWKYLHIFLCFHTSSLGFPLSLMQDGAGLYLDIPTQWPWQSVEESILFVKGNSSQSSAYTAVLSPADPM